MDADGLKRLRYGVVLRMLRVIFVMDGLQPLIIVSYFTLILSIAVFRIEHWQWKTLLEMKIGANRTKERGPKPELD